MKEERLIGNSGIQEVRQQCLDLLEEIRRTAGVLNEYFAVEDSEEYIDVILDNERKVVFGITKDGITYIPNLYCPTLTKDISQFKESIEQRINYLNEYIHDGETPEWLRLTIDKDKKIIDGITVDGKKVINVETIIKELLHCECFDVDGVIIDTFDDVEGRLGVTIGSDGKILSYRDKSGFKVEGVGLKTPVVETEELHLKNNPFYEVQPSIEKDTIYVERPKLGEIWFEGTLPTDMSDDRTPTWLTMTFKNSGVPQFKCRCTLAIQGHGSAGYAKKGYTLEPYNADDEAISIKFGDMIAIDSFHLKAYATDSLHCRDMANFNIWRDMIRQLDYPYSKFNTTNFALSTDYNKNKLDTADAKFAPDGFPVVCYLNGEFLGLYTIKLKKSRQNYAMEKSVKKQIFLDAVNYSASMDNGFNPHGWDVKNPKMKNYEEGGEIPDATVLATINRFFDWLKQIDVNDPSTYQDYADYMNLPHWIVFIIFEELVFSQDIINNNINLACWDGSPADGHWTIIPYDTDLSVGLHPWDTLPPYQSYVILTEGTRFVLDYGIFTKLTAIFDSEIKAMWNELRNNGFITPQNIVNYYIEQSKAIPRDVYSKDYDKWGTIWTNGIPCVEQLYVFINNRIAWLDQHWLNQN